MSLGWWTRVLLVAMFVRAVCAEVENPVGPEVPPKPTDTTVAEQPFDSQSLAAYMDKAARGQRDDVRLESPSQNSGSTGLTAVLAQLLFSLVVIVGLIYGLGYGLKRLAGRNLLNPTGPLKILARHSVSPKSSVYLVAAFDRFLLIGESPQGLTCLSEFNDSEENERRRRTWGWEASNERGSSLASKVAAFTPIFHSHVTELEREIDQYREASR